MSVGNIKTPAQMERHGQGQPGQDHKKQPDLRVIEGGLLPPSHTEHQIGDQLNVQIYKDPKNLVSFFQLMGEKTLRFAIFSGKRCVDIYKAALSIQKKLGSSSRGGIVDKKVE